jgi:hypothetical protein
MRHPALRSAFPFILLTLGIALMFAADPPAARAQILNIEKRRLEKEEERYFVGNVGVTFNYTNRSPTLRQPARVMNTGLTSNVAYFTEAHVFMLINEYQVFLFNEAQLVNTGLTHARAQFFREERIGFEVYSQFQYDVPRGMRRRGLIGVGPRFRLVQSDKFNLTAGTGVMYEQEYWDFPDNNDRARARFAKSSSYLSTRYEPSEGINLNAIVYFQTGYDRAFGLFRHRISGDVNISVTLIGKLSLTSTFSGSYETEPVVPIIPFIFSTTNGVRFDF